MAATVTQAYNAWLHGKKVKRILMGCEHRDACSLDDAKAAYDQAYAASSQSGADSRSVKSALLGAFLARHRCATCFPPSTWPRKRRRAAAKLGDSFENGTGGLARLASAAFSSAALPDDALALDFTAHSDESLGSGRESGRDSTYDENESDGVGDVHGSGNADCGFGFSVAFGGSVVTGVSVDWLMDEGAGVGGVNGATLDEDMIKGAYAALLADIETTTPATAATARIAAVVTAHLADETAASQRGFEHAMSKWKTWLAKSPFRAHAQSMLDDEFERANVGDGDEDAGAVRAALTRCSKVCEWLQSAPADVDMDGDAVAAAAFGSKRAALAAATV